MVLGKLELKFVKGVAITAMVFHHLFGFTARLDPTNVFMQSHGSSPLLEWFAGFAKFCVPMFLFLSGCGFASGGKFTAAYSFGKAWRFLGAYWWYFLWTIPIGVLFGGDTIAGCRIEDFGSSPLRIFENLLLVRIDFNQEWWFVRPYLLLVISLPVLGRIRTGFVGTLAWSGTVYLIGYLGLKFSYASLEPLFQVLACQFPFAMGMWMARAPDQIRQGWLFKLGSLPLLFGFCFAAFAVLHMPSLVLVVPVLFVGFVNLRNRLPGGVVRVFEFLGDASMPIWLTHSFLCYYYAQALVYSFRSWLPTFLVMMVVATSLALALESLRNALVRRLQKARTTSRVSPGQAM
jgi:hypothetical protein